MDISLIIITLSIILMILSILFGWELKIKKLNLKLYYIFPLLCAIILIFAGAVKTENLKKLFFSNSDINALKILAIFLSFSGLSILIDELGFFKYLARTIVKKYKKSQTTLFISFSILVSVLTIFTSNDILILTLTPFICHFAKHAKIDPIPYVVAEFVMANTWSMFFFLGNPTNIYVSTAFGISFAKYVSTMFLPTIAAGLTAFILTFVIFRKKLKKALESPDDRSIKLYNFPLTISLFGLFTAIVLSALSQTLNIPIWAPPLFCCLATYFIVFLYFLIQKNSLKIFKNSLKKLPVEIIPFLISMSILVEALINSNLVREITQTIQSSTIFIFGTISFLSGNIFNNIPMTMLFTNIIALTNSPEKLAYTLIITSNISALLTPIGALAGIMFMKILKHNQIKFSFKRFIAYGTLISIPTLLASLLVLYFI